uniref:Uncharacterized protein n=1 Tax=Rhizophora mucronata TaxID=61149 RepID=A0A2P2PLK0_RHIMU
MKYIQENYTQKKQKLKAAREQNIRQSPYCKQSNIQIGGSNGFP